MKSRFLAILVSILLSNCQDPYLKINPFANNNPIEVPDIIKPQESINDPEQCGLACTSNNKNRPSVELIDVIEIPHDLPDNYDLSENMPPVRSQGAQGSCVAWATTYYLKSYQEKMQYGYNYESYEDVMSPAFVYNQSKANINCNSGSIIEEALEVLKRHGTNNWKDFPYSDDQCSNLPTDNLLSIASKNKIKDYFLLGIPDTNTDANYTLINLIKTLLYQKNPIVVGLDWQNLIFKNLDEEIIATSYATDPIDDCGHAVLIVGYNDEMNAFKFVNSWGTAWGNKGYGWIHFDFFLPSNHADYKEGFDGGYIAYDEDE